MLFGKQEYAGSGEAVGYDSSRSKRITYHRLIWNYNNTLLSEEFCFHCLLVFSVKKQRDLSLFNCIHRRDESKVQSSEGQMKLNLLSMLPRNSKFDCHTLLKRFKIQIQQRGSDRDRICLSEDEMQQSAVLFLFSLIDLAISFGIFRAVINGGKY